MIPSRLKTDVLFISHEHYDHGNAAGVEYQKKVDEPVKEESFGIFYEGFSCFHDEVQGKKRGKNVAFCCKMDDVTLCHMGDVGEISEDLARNLRGVDVLFLPVGGTYTVDAIGAKRYVDMVKPKIVIPMHFKTADLNIDIDGVEPFLTLCKDLEIRREKGETCIERADLNGQRTLVLHMEKK